MNKKKGIGALLLFVGAFFATRRLLSNADWTGRHYLLLAGCALLIGFGIYLITLPSQGE